MAQPGDRRLPPREKSKILTHELEKRTQNELENALKCFVAKHPGKEIDPARLRAMLEEIWDYHCAHPVLPYTSSCRSRSFPASHCGRQGVASFDPELTSSTLSVRSKR